MKITGGCLCGKLRYEAEGPAGASGYCFCGDCRKASGSGFIPFMNFKVGTIRFTGQPLLHRSPNARGGEAARNSCAVCGGLVFGGEIGNPHGHTVYAGSLDDASQFHPTMAIFNKSRPAWVPLPKGLTVVFEGMPG